MFLLAGCGGQELTILAEQDLPQDVYGSPTPAFAAELPPRGIVYFVRNRTLAPLSQPLEGAPSLGEALLDALLQGPPAGIDVRTSIPFTARVLGFELDLGVATVDLSREFELGGRGTSLALRVAQVVYTLTEDPSVLAVLFAIEGVPTPVVTGSERVLDRPVTRQDYATLFPGGAAASEQGEAPSGR